jgi:hypothetical protein
MASLQAMDGLHVYCNAMRSMGRYSLVRPQKYLTSRQHGKLVCFGLI